MYESKNFNHMSHDKIIKKTSGHLEKMSRVMKTKVFTGRNGDTNLGLNKQKSIMVGHDAIALNLLLDNIKKDEDKTLVSDNVHFMAPKTHNEKIVKNNVTDAVLNNDQWIKRRDCMRKNQIALTSLYFCKQGLKNNRKISQKNETQSPQKKNHERKQSRFSLITDLFDHEYKGVDSRTGKIPEFLQQILIANTWTFLSIFSTLISLYLPDLVYVYAHPDLDLYLLDYLLTSIMAFFIIDVFLCMSVRKNYLGSFYFWLDFIGTVSLISDIPWMQLLVMDQLSHLTLAKGGRASRIAKSASSTRIVSRALRMLRMSKIARAVRLMKYTKKSSSLGNADTDHKDIETIGNRLSESLSKNIITGVLFMIILIPLFDIAEVPVSSNLKHECLQMGHLYLSNQTVFNHILKHKLQLQTTRTNYHKNFVADVWYFEFNNTELYRDEVFEKNMRRNKDTFDVIHLVGEDETLISKFENHYVDIIHPYGDNRRVFNSTSFSCINKFNIRPFNISRSYLNMCMTTFVVLLFSFSTWLIFSDSKHLVVQPLSRTVKIITDLTRSVFWLSMEGQEMSMHEAEKIEKELVHGILKQVGLMFKSLPPDDDDDMLEKMLNHAIDQKALHIKSEKDKQHSVFLNPVVKFWDGNSDEDSFSSDVIETHSPKLSAHIDRSVSTHHIGFCDRLDLMYQPTSLSIVEDNLEEQTNLVNLDFEL